MTVIEIVKNYIEENGFDGLCNEDCGCMLGDIPLCGDPFYDCIPAYFHDSLDTCPNDCKMGCFNNGETERVFCAISNGLNKITTSKGEKP
jgi:hypothetical protein